MFVSPADRGLLDAQEFRASVAVTLRSLSEPTLRRLAASWPTERNLAELIVADAIAEALEEIDDASTARSWRQDADAAARAAA